MWPAIFLPLNTRPGSCRLPVEPWLRCETDTPCEARRPPKLCRFIAPAKPLPIETPETSTILAGDEMADMDLGPDLEQRLLGIDPELADHRLRLDLRLGEVAAHRLGDVLGLARADAELDGRVAVLLRGPHGHDLALLDLQDGDGHMAPVIAEQASHAHLLGNQPGTQHGLTLRA